MFSFGNDQPNRIPRRSLPLKLAGVPQKDWVKPRTIRTKEWVIESIRTRYRNGESLAGNKVPRILHAAGRNRFDAWRSALRAAGIPEEHFAPWTKEMVLGSNSSPAVFSKAKSRLGILSIPMPYTKVLTEFSSCHGSRYYFVERPSLPGQ